MPRIFYCRHHYGAIFYEDFGAAVTIGPLGELALLVQMFFIGTKSDVQTFAKQAGKPLIGVAAQLMLSFVFVMGIGCFYLLGIRETLLYTFVISLSGSAIILEYLEKSNALDKPLGMLISVILVQQYFLLVPMLLAINFMGWKKLPVHTDVSLIASLLPCPFY